MATVLIHSLFSHVWSIFLVILFFEGSVFVHELGHFLAARKCGVKVERFAIGFGPAIWSFTGKDGVLYSLCWIPLGGYVLLPQLADLSEIEGESTVDITKLPPVSYGSKMLIFVAGATFNILFAYLLACVLWAIGTPESKETTTTEIGFIIPQIEVANGLKVPSPALVAGLRIGDVITQVDGDSVNDWNQVRQDIAMSSGRDATGHPQTLFTVRRNNEIKTIVVLPLLATEDKLRQVGIGPAFDLIVYSVSQGSLAEKSGIKVNDEIVSIDSVRLRSNVTLGEYLQAHENQAVSLGVKRGSTLISLTVPPINTLSKDSDFGLTFDPGVRIVHYSPISLVRDQFMNSFHTLSSLINPHSDIGLSKLSGPIGIITMLNRAAEVGLPAIMMLTVMINVSLAVLNLMPIPVLDGGQMLFATIGKIRGKALPNELLIKIQSAFLILILSMVLYVSFFDVRRIARDVQHAHTEATKSK
jgi:regulator of sigma E protease